jgi:hypothetical protein
VKFGGRLSPLAECLRVISLPRFLQVARNETCAAQRVVGCPQAAAMRFNDGAADPQSMIKAGHISAPAKKVLLAD